MRIFAILLLVVSVCVLSFGNSYADSISSSLENKKIYVFAQIEIRNSDGNLVAYMESKKIAIFDLEQLNQLLDQSTGKVEKNTITLDGKNYEFIKGTGVSTPSYPTVASKNLISNNQNGTSQILVEADHDGYPVIPGDKVTTTWTIIRPLH